MNELEAKVAKVIAAVRERDPAIRYVSIEGPYMEWAAATEDKASYTTIELRWHVSAQIKRGEVVFDADGATLAELADAIKGAQ